MTIYDIANELTDGDIFALIEIISTLGRLTDIEINQIVSGQISRPLKRKLVIIIIFLIQLIKKNMINDKNKIEIVDLYVSFLNRLRDIIHNEILIQKITKYFSDDFEKDIAYNFKSLIELKTRDNEEISYFSPS